MLTTDIFEWALVRSGVSGSVRMLAAGTLARRVKLPLTTTFTTFRDFTAQPVVLTAS